MASRISEMTSRNCSYYILGQIAAVFWQSWVEMLRKASIYCLTSLRGSSGSFRSEQVLSSDLNDFPDILTVTDTVSATSFFTRSGSLSRRIIVLMIPSASNPSSHAAPEKIRPPPGPYRSDRGLRAEGSPSVAGRGKSLPALYGRAIHSLSSASVIGNRIIRSYDRALEVEHENEIQG
jgi:hypothetical protein